MSSEKKDRKRVQKAVRKLHKAIDKGEKNRLQRDFANREKEVKREKIRALFSNMPDKPEGEGE